MEPRQFEKLMGKLDLLIKLTAVNMLRDKEPKEKVKILFGLGLKPIEIARIIDKSQNYVNVYIYRIRRDEQKPANQPGEMLSDQPK